jgi:hypothetical protein
MKKSKYLLLIGSLGAAVAGAAVAPGVAQADQCCQSAWSPLIENGNQQTECDVAVGGGRVDGHIMVFSNDRDVIYGLTSSAAYSPAIRHKVKCNGAAENLGDWIYSEVTGYGCGTAGVQWARCRTRLADGFYCGSSCGSEDIP